MLQVDEAGNIVDSCFRHLAAALQLHPAALATSGKSFTPLQSLWRACTAIASCIKAQHYAVESVTAVRSFPQLGFAVGWPILHVHGCRVKGRSFDDVLTIKNSEIAKHLSLPPVKLHCSMLAEDAIKAAVKDIQAKRARRPARDWRHGGRDVAAAQRLVMKTVPAAQAMRLSL